MNLLDELKKIPEFNGHVAYRREVKPPGIWVYSFGINNTTVDVKSSVNHGYWTDEEMQDVLNLVKDAAGTGRD